jgi:hypothetical protein
MGIFQTGRCSDSGNSRRTYSFFRDRCLLAISAVGVGILLLSGAFALALAGVDEVWTELWMVTVLLFLSAITVWVRTVRSTPVWRLPRKPFVLTWVGLLLAHLVVLGSILRAFHPHWRMGEWMLVGWAEWMMFAVIIGRVQGTMTRVRHRGTKQPRNRSNNDIGRRVTPCP